MFSQVLRSFGFSVVILTIAGSVIAQEPLAVYKAKSDQIAISFSKDGKFLGAGGGDGFVTIWTFPAFKLVSSFKAHREDTDQVVFLKNGKVVLTCGQRSKIKKWDPKKPNKEGTSVFANGLSLQDVSADESMMVVYYWATNRIEVRDVDFRKTIFTFKGPPDVLSCVLSKDGKYCASGHFAGQLVLWSLKTGKMYKNLPGHTDGVGPLAFSPCGKFLVSSSWDWNCKLWDVEKGKLLKTFKLKPGAPTVAFSPDGKLLAAGLADGLLKIWTTADYNLIAEKKIHDKGIWSIAFSPDGRYLASGSWDKTVKVWEMKQLLTK